MRIKGTKTKYPGVFKIGDKAYRIHAKAVDPRTGKKREKEAHHKGISLQEAAGLRAVLLEGIRNPTPPILQVRVVEFAESWMRSKALKIGGPSARTYADALDLHLLPVFGDFFYHAITHDLVQEWVDDSLLAQWTTPKGRLKNYQPPTVHCWFRVFRTMTRDAVVSLKLPTDPTLRIEFPPFPDKGFSKAITAQVLADFLHWMQRLYPQHYALTIALAYSGQRFCHVSAWQWDDWNQDRGVIKVQRRQVRGDVGPVSRKKQAPKEYPVPPELEIVLRWQQRVLAESKAPGFEDGWMFPSSTGTLRVPSSLSKAWKRCMEAAGIEKKFTIHGLRYTFNDLVRRANVDPIVRRALLGHVTERMQERYSTVDIDEKRDAVRGALRLVQGGKR